MWRGWGAGVVVCVHPYYAMHALTFISYPLLRMFVVRFPSPADGALLIKWEVQAVLSLSIVLLIKYAKLISLEAFLADALLYGKGPENISYLTPLQLENELLNGSQLWLVEFGAVCSTRCIQSTRLFAELSLRYSKANLQFARVDLGRFPHAAVKYGITFGVTSQHVPTLVLFESGVEVSRLSQDSMDGIASIQKFTEALIVEHFELDHLLIRQLSQKFEGFSHI